jgi:hypothetical protein
MAIEQTILFTIMPRGITANGKTLPVSVFVSPRLSGADYLGAFGDWVDWTRKLREYGLKLRIQCGANQRDFPIDQRPLRPKLWEQLFNAQTYVRSHDTFDDYSDRAVMSFSVRRTFSALKTIYQQASVALALPDKLGAQSVPIGIRDLPVAAVVERVEIVRAVASNRQRLRTLVNGLQVHWDGRFADRLRETVRLTPESPGFPGTQGIDAPLDSEGAIISEPNPVASQAAAMPFAAFHHMPALPDKQYQPPELPDPNKLFDFHQALSSLNSYPDLLRALGITFDLDLPSTFVPDTTNTPFGTISIQSATPGWQWMIQPQFHSLATAYIKIHVSQKTLFFTAPRAVSSPPSPPPPPVIGLLDLDSQHFGLAQVDVDGAMHKAIMLAESLNPSGAQNAAPGAEPEAAPHPEVFDPEATLPSLRSGGFSLYADNRGLQLLASLQDTKKFNEALNNQPRHFFAEDLVRGYRLDVWDSRTAQWHSLHRRKAKYKVGDLSFTPPVEPEEGFVQLAATQPPPGAQPETKDLYLHEAIARWAGWSLSAPRPGKHLSRHANADYAIPRDDDPEKFAEDQPETPFKITAHYQVVQNSLPELRFGRRYRFRARVVDLAGNSLAWNDSLVDLLATIFALPRDPEGFAYLRFEPVPAPLVVIRNPKAVTDPGSAVERLVIRTFNNSIDKDHEPADTTAADRHIIPPRASIEIGEHLGIFDDANGKLIGDKAMWKLIADRDAGELNTQLIAIASGPRKKYPVERGKSIDYLSYFPDPLSRGAAIRDLPGTPSGAIGRVVPDVGAATAVAYDFLSDPNPRPGSATLVSFGESGDWQKTRGFRFVLAEPAKNQKDLGPHWDPNGRVLTVYLPKGQTAVVPLTSYTSVDDLKIMGVWQWLRQFIEQITVTQAHPQLLEFDADEIAHVLQRAAEGGHWMLTPPRLLTLVHAVQQPLGRPAFTALNIVRQNGDTDSVALQTAPDRGRRDPTELAPITAWRRLGATEAYLLGALKIHGASTARVDLLAAWDDPVDDLSQQKPDVVHHTAPVDELALPSISEDYLVAPGKEHRAVGYYDPEHDQIAFTRRGDKSASDRGQATSDVFTFVDPAAPEDPARNPAPRHLLNDTKRHIVSYHAISTSRFREYFDPKLHFTRTSEPVVVDVPASARPLAPDVVYVVPTFGWERQADTNLKRSVRFGGGLRVYFRRPWFSSGSGELLGVTLWSDANGPLDAVSRDKFKPFFTQWGMDPIWQTDALGGAPDFDNFVGFAEQDSDVSLEEKSAAIAEDKPGRVSVVGFEPQFDEARGLWFADVAINIRTETYMPFVRLALVRYQPHALADAKISRVVLADFAQLTPERSATVMSDPHHPHTIRVVVSGIAPRGPKPTVQAEPPPKDVSATPTQIRVRVQQRDPAIESDLAWNDVADTVAQVNQFFNGALPTDQDLMLWFSAIGVGYSPTMRALLTDQDLVLWFGTITFTEKPQPGQFRLVIEEREFTSAKYTVIENEVSTQPSRLIYAEIFALDEALVTE